MLRVTFLDVGQGDAAFIELPEGPRLLVDGGPGGARRFDVGERVLAPFLWNRPLARLDVVALTHWDTDHSGGLAAVLSHFHVGEFWESGRPPGGAPETVAALLRSRAPRRVLAAGQRLVARPCRDHRARAPARIRRQSPTTSPSCCGSTGGGCRCCSPVTLARRGEALLLERAGPGARPRPQGRASRQPVLVHRAVPRAGAAASRGRSRWARAIPSAIRARRRSPGSTRPARASTAPIATARSSWRPTGACSGSPRGPAASPRPGSSTQKTEPRRKARFPSSPACPKNTTAPG